MLLLAGIADGVKAMVYTKFLKETLVPSGKKNSLSLRSIIDSFTETFKALKWMPRALLGFCAMEVLFGFAWSMVGPFFTLYALDVVSLTPVEWGLLSTIEMVLASVFACLVEDLLIVTVRDGFFWFSRLPRHLAS